MCIVEFRTAGSLLFRARRLSILVESVNKGTYISNHLAQILGFGFVVKYRRRLEEERLFPEYTCQSCALY